nr:MAG TPA: hypothetical protein [Caudoviricetes sp.]
MFQYRKKRLQKNKKRKGKNIISILVEVSSRLAKRSHIVWPF